MERKYKMGQRILYTFKIPVKYDGVTYCGTHVGRIFSTSEGAQMQQYSFTLSDTYRMPYWIILEEDIVPISEDCTKDQIEALKKLVDHEI